MNYLAHLYLAEPTSESLVGNLLGDFVTGLMSRLEGKYPEEILRGIRMHRQVDKFTDTHAIFRQSKDRIHPKFSLLKGILIDVFYDHYLAKNWENYSKLSLNGFTVFVYQSFHKHRAILPEPLSRMLPFMESENWLASYAEIDSIQLILQRIGRRLKRKNNLAEGIHQLTKNYELLEQDFQEFFPQLISFSHTLKTPQSLREYACQ